MRSKSVKIYLFVFLIAGLCIERAFVFAQSDEQRMQRAQEYFSAGKEFLRQGNYTAADNEFKKAQQLLGAGAAAVPKPKPAAVPLVAVKESAEKEKERAKSAQLARDPLSYYVKAIELNPKNADLHYNLALEYMKNNHYKEAEVELKRTLQLNPRDKDTCYNLGVIYESYFSDKAQAVYYYSRYVALAPRADDAWRVRVWIKDLKKQITNEK